MNEDIENLTQVLVDWTEYYDQIIDEIMGDRK
jgi:hypothetical protein